MNASSTIQKTAYHHGDLRAQLLNATRQLVEEKGPDRFSISEACRAAGVTTAAPYRHFSDKREMLVAVAMEGMERLREAMKAAVAERTDGTVDSITALGMAYVGFAKREPGVFRLMFGLTRDHGKHELMMALGQETFGILLSQVAAYLGKPNIDDEVTRRGFALWTSVHGMSFLLIDDKVDVVKFPIDMDELIGEMAVRLLA
ncbi:MAG: TetR/AcrR family transcriptional regulator [Hyphomicrobiales bacterium]|nr:TetR/AcrR family transcriptional regulator [Hyphomicrobiales bacterium]